MDKGGERERRGGSLTEGGGEERMGEWEVREREKRAAADDSREIEGVREREGSKGGRGEWERSIKGERGRERREEGVVERGEVEKYVEE